MQKVDVLSVALCLVLQLAGQSVEAFMAKRNYHAMPQHEDVWAAPVSDMPAAYNLHARMQALAEEHQKEHEQETVEESEQDQQQAAREQQPRKSKQPVRRPVLAFTATALQCPLHVQSDPIDMPCTFLCPVQPSTLRATCIHSILHMRLAEHEAQYIVRALTEVLANPVLLQCWRKQVGAKRRTIWLVCRLRCGRLQP